MQQDVKDLIQAESYLAGLEAAEATIPERLQAAAEAGDFAVYATVQAELQALPALLNRARIQVLKLQKAAIDVQITEEKGRLADSIQAFKEAQAEAAEASKRATAAQVAIGRVEARVSSLQDRRRTLETKITETIRAGYKLTDTNKAPVVRSLVHALPG